MQQRAVEKSVSRFEPIVEKFAQALHFSLQQLNAKTFPPNANRKPNINFGKPWKLMPSRNRRPLCSIA